LAFSGLRNLAVGGAYFSPDHSEDHLPLPAIVAIGGSRIGAPCGAGSVPKALAAPEVGFEDGTAFPQWRLPGDSLASAFDPGRRDNEVEQSVSQGHMPYLQTALHEPQSDPQQAERERWSARWFRFSRLWGPRICDDRRPCSSGRLPLTVVNRIPNRSAAEGDRRRIASPDTSESGVQT
jgi:hypothetical protein